ncbi:hypothetical protein BH20ACI1_BH20ACI1_17340 [soil metagenome]
MDIIHRDIKPQNLLLTEDRQTVKIADFGVARMSQSDSPITRVGTNMFAPPEHSPMFSGNTGTLTVAELTPAADIYSLAKSAYVLITCESPRFFTNNPITELPFDMRQKRWANELVKVLNKATQNDPKERHQNVTEFWQDLSRIKLLAEAEDGENLTEVSPHTIPQPHISKGYTPLAPQLPRFNTSKDFKVNPNLSAANRLPLVVKLDNNYQTPIKQPPIIENESVQEQEIFVQPKQKRQWNFPRRLTIFAIFIGLFAGILYGTHNYLRGRGVLPEIRNPFGRQQIGTANTDVNLRSSGSNEGDKIGLIPKDSRVRIVGSQDNWYEVDIIQYGRPKENPDFADHGWIYGKYVDVDN